MKRVQFSVCDIITIATAVPVAIFLARTSVVLPPFLTTSTVANDFLTLAQESAKKWVSWGPCSHVLLTSCVADTPTITFATFLAAILGATRSRFGLATGMFFPLFIVFWSYFIGPRGIVLWHMPFVFGVAIAYLAILLGWHAVSGVDPKSRSFRAYRCFAFGVIGILAATSELWWSVYWSV